MKKVYLSILLLLCVATNLYAAAEENSFVVFYDQSDGLPGTLTEGHYVWESELCTAETPINGVRLTFFITYGGVLFNGYPSVAIGELEFYDADGNKIAYTAENVSTNSLEGLEGAIENLNDGVYTTYYHSAWRTNVIEEELDDYVYLDITFPEAVSQFKIKQVSRSLGYVTYVIPIGIIVTPVGVNYADVELPTSGSCGENLTWNFDAESGALSIEGSGEMYPGAISPMLTNVIKTVNLSDGITSIGDYAFSGCIGLTSITIPEGVTSIGENAFYNCAGLTGIVVDNNNSAYDSREGCNAIIHTATNTLIQGCNNTTIPSSVTSIGDNAFSGCSGLTSITIPEGVTSIGNNAFNGCSGLTSITIPEGVTTIRISTFYNCTGLTSITIPSSVETIAIDVFIGCNALESVYISDYEAWSNIVFANYTTSNPLNYASNLYVNGKPVVEELIIPEGVTSIDNGAYKDCTFLKSVIIPEGVTSIGDNAFSGCSRLTSITIPEGVTSIGNNAFRTCSRLTNITIPSSVTSIGDNAFSGCSGLTSITIPEGVTSIGDSAFEGCDGLTSITIPESVTNIEDYAFYACSGLTSITIPESVTSIGDYAFYGCFSLDTVIAFPEIAPTISSETFAGTSVLYYPVGSDYSSWFSYFSTSKPYENTLKVADVDAVPGEQIKLSVNMSNGSNITAMQFDVLLPSGLTFATDEDGYELIELSSARTNSRKHILTCGYMPDESTMRVIIYSNSNIFFSGNEGEVITMTLNVSPGVADGDYSIIFKDIELVEITNDQSEIPHITEEMVTVVKVERIMGDLTGDKKVSIADVVSLVGVLMGSSTDNLNMDVADMNNDGRISITDVVSVVSKIFDSSTPAAPAAAAAPAVRTGSLSEVSENRMYIEPFTLGAGEEKEILVYLDNPDVDITAFQFDIRLPEGIEIPIDFVDGENTYYQVYLGSRTNSRLHSDPECGELYDGLYRIAVYSSKNSNFKERSGDVVSMFVRGSETLSPGVYELEMSNIEIVEYNEEAIPYILADYTSSIVSGDGASTAPMLKGVFSTESMSELSSAFKDNTDITSLDLRNAVSIDSEGRILTGNPNTLILLPEGMSLSNEHNVIIGNTCSSFSLTDGYTFASPVDFTAESFVYNRTVDAAKTVSFILPVSIDASNLNGTVYELSDVSGSELNFTEVHGILEANKPYLLLTDAQGTMLGDDITNVTVIATPETEMSVTIGNIRHIGSYAQQSVESSSSVAYYGYSEGAFVKALTGTLNPYRTMIASDNVTAAKVKSYSLLLNGTTTGIEDPAGDEADGLIYDLYGRKLEQITSPGFYIVNGKKVYIK